MLGPYNTSVTPQCYYYNPLLYCCAHVVPVLLSLCPIEAQYCYCSTLTLLLLYRLCLYYDPLDPYR